MTSDGANAFEILIEQPNADGNRVAVLESDATVCYFYIFAMEGDDRDVYSVWVRNLVDAPAALDGDGMKSGEPPLNPSEFCRYSQGQAAPEPDGLEVVWLPEGNGAGLYENGELLAIIPPWSGQNGFHGYARDNIAIGPLAWPLEPNNTLIPRLESARAFWRIWEKKETWPEIQTAFMAAYEQQLGPHSSYYAIDGGNWPPKAILRVPYQDGIVLVTVGVSIRPQPNVEFYTDDYRPLSRVELGVVLPANWPDGSIDKFGPYLAGQSSLPWARCTWLGPGHTIPCDAWRAPEFKAALLSHSHPAVPEISLPDQFGDPVHVLWFIPITEQEREAAKERSSSSVLAQPPDSRWRDC